MAIGTDPSVPMARSTRQKATSPARKSPPLLAERIFSLMVLPDTRYRHGSGSQDRLSRLRQTGAENKRVREAVQDSLSELPYCASLRPPPPATSRPGISASA